jgi:hypothetical protein
MNDDLLVDFENLQMLQCIVYRSEKAIGIFLSQSFILKMELIKYNKINGITPILLP